MTDLERGDSVPGNTLNASGVSSEQSIPNAQTDTRKETGSTVRDGLIAAVRAAKQALFVIRKQGVMPNSSWEAGFNKDLKIAEDALAAPDPKSDPVAEVRHWPDPTPEMLDNDPLFDAIWNAIKKWDVNVPSAYSGYCGATGNHARAIYDAIRATPQPAGASEAEVIERCAKVVESHGREMESEGLTLKPSGLFAIAKAIRALALRDGPTVGEVLPFVPAAAPRRVDLSRPCQVFILPVVRVERHDEDLCPAPVIMDLSPEMKAALDAVARQMLVELIAKPMAALICGDDRPVL